MQSKWFEHWFNSKYYHILYKDRDDQEARAFIDALLNKLHFAPQSKVLDLACGKGRHSRYLATKGLDVVGMDLSSENVNYALGFAAENLAFEQQDMREPFGDDRFDVVMNLFTSFGYFGNLGENEKVCKNIQHALKQKGTLVLDYLNPVWVEKQFKQSDVKEFEGVRFEISKQIEGKQIVKNIDVNDAGKTFHFEERVDLITPDQFQAMFQHVGLACEHIFGNYQLEAFDAEHSPRMIFIAHRA